MSRDTLGSADPFSGEEMGEPAPYASRKALRYTSALLQTATQADRAAALFRIASEASGFCVYVLVIEHPVLGGPGHPLAQLIAGPDALERSMSLYDRAVSAVTRETDR